jgi:quinol monooxygenase YgiN
MVRLTVVLVASPQGSRYLLEALRSLMVPTRLEQGCLAAHAWSDADSTVTYFEEWATEHDVQRRVKSDRFTSLLAVMEAAEEPPDVRFDFSTSTRGLEYIEEIRQGFAP